MSEAASVQNFEQAAIPAQAAPERLVLSALPHVRSPASITRTMLWVLVALMPTAGIAVMLSGLHALFTILLSVATAMAAEWALLFCLRKKQTIPDGSAAITGLLVALSLPPHLPLWVAPAGSLFAIGLVKMVFGGLGRNFLNPAMTGRAFLALSLPVLFNAGAASSGGEFPLPAGAHEINTMLLNFCTGYQSGWMGSSSAFALLAGAVLLWSLRIIDFTLPISFIAAAFLLFWSADANHALFSGNALLYALFQVLGSGVLFGAFFLATDPVTSPSTKRSRFLFGAGCGVLSFLFQRGGAPDSGIMYAILLMNFTIPYMDRYLVRQTFGAQRKRSVSGNTAPATRNDAPVPEPETANMEPSNLETESRRILPPHE